MSSFSYRCRVLSLLPVVLCATAAQADTATTDRLVHRFVQLDRDGDGVSFEEFMRMIESRARREYSQMDANGDGRVSAAEYRRFWNQRKARYYRVRR